MITIIAGSRGATDYNDLLLAIKWSPFKVTTVISGNARGADTLGKQYASEKGLPLKIYSSKWNDYGKIAGFIRNEQMASVAEALIALWDGNSRGTQHMIETAYKEGLEVFVFNIAE